MHVLFMKKRTPHSPFSPTTRIDCLFDGPGRGPKKNKTYDSTRTSIDHLSPWTAKPKYSKNVARARRHKQTNRHRERERQRARSTPSWRAARQRRSAFPSPLFQEKRREDAENISNTARRVKTKPSRTFFLLSFKPARQRNLQRCFFPSMYQDVSHLFPSPSRNETCAYVKEPQLSTGKKIKAETRRSWNTKCSTTSFLIEYPPPPTCHLPALHMLPTK